MRFVANIGTAIGTEHGPQKHISQSDIGKAVVDAMDQPGVPHRISWRMSDKGDRKPELVVVVTIDIDPNTDQFADMWHCLLGLVRTTGQDCIALQGVQHSDGGTMLFHPNYCGERYLFDSAYFTPAEQWEATVSKDRASGTFCCHITDDGNEAGTHVGFRTACQAKFAADEICEKMNAQTKN